jgi:hypothetical protein
MKLDDLQLHAVAESVQEPFPSLCDAFTNEYNLHFGHTKVDTRQKYDKLQMQLEETDNTETEITAQE